VFNKFRAKSREYLYFRFLILDIQFLKMDNIGHGEEATGRVREVSEFQGFRVSRFTFKVQGFRVHGSAFRVQSLKFQS
jgi:hypothetical protein